MPNDWKARCLARQRDRFESIPSEWRIKNAAPEAATNVMHVPETCGLLSAEELDITNLNVEELLPRLASGELSSLKVTTAFCKRAMVAQQVTNCLTVIFVEKAFARAAELDRHLKETGKVAGRLHGLPVSLKDQFAIKGLETSIGYVSRIGDISQKNSVLTDILLDAGTVLYVKTNLPQTIMPGETHNHVFGRTLNPFNRTLTPGGSSGGEGALLAMRGSPLGVGTDIGGSVRIPAVYCGLYSLRPSYERLPYEGAVNTLEGQESISSVIGPMANSLTALEIFTRAVLEAKPWMQDPLVVLKPWDEDAYALRDHGGKGAKLCFAIMWDNGVIKPHPPIIHAMELVKDALEECGHQVLDWENHRHQEIYANAEEIFAADGGEDYRRECEKGGEPLLSMHPEERHEKAWDVPLNVTLVEDPKRILSAYELWQLHRQKRELRKSYGDHWNATMSRTHTGRPIDAIICPATSSTAPPHGLNTDAFYTTLCNSLDYACAAFPVATVDVELHRPVSPHAFRNHEDAAIHSLYSPELFEGTPIGLQLVGRRLEEEAVLAMTGIVVDALRKHR